MGSLQWLIVVIFNQFQLLVQKNLPFPHPQPLGRHRCICPWSSLHRRAREVSMNTVQQISGTCALTTESCFWPEGYRPWNRPPLLHSCPLLQSPSPWSEEISRGFKQMVHFIHPPFFFSFSPFWELDIEEWNIQKQTHLWRKLDNISHMQGKL